MLAGDHLQLPPTVLSHEAAVMGLNKSILEVGFETAGNIFLLNTQYRMREAIAGFSGNYFYSGLLQTAAHLINVGVHISFIDTAGSGYNEVQGKNGMSLQNEGELLIVQKLLETELADPSAIGFYLPLLGAGCRS